MGFVLISNNNRDYRPLADWEQCAVDNLTKIRDAPGPEGESSRSDTSRWLGEEKEVPQLHDGRLAPFSAFQPKHTDGLIGDDVEVIGHLACVNYFYLLVIVDGKLGWSTQATVEPRRLKTLLTTAWFASKDESDRRWQQRGLWDTRWVLWQYGRNDVGTEAWKQLFGEKYVEADWLELDRLVGDFTCALADGDMVVWRRLVSAFLPELFTSRPLAARFMACAALSSLKAGRGPQFVQEFEKLAREKAKQIEVVWPEMGKLFATLYQAISGDVTASEEFDRLRETEGWRRWDIPCIFCVTYPEIERYITKKLRGNEASR